MMDSISGFFVDPSVYETEDLGVVERIGGHPDGYCEIYKFDKGGRFRTLKCLQPSYRDNPLYRNLLRKEFEIGYSLSHNHICEYYEWLNHPQFGPCIEMEWVDGRTLEKMLAEEKHPAEVYDKIVTEICEALGYMHSKQVLHKDLKPSNILITYNGNNVKIIDFGVSDADSSSVLKVSAGTAGYAAPEVLKGGKASVRSDLYSLGLVISLFPVRKYASVVKRLCAADPGKRPGSIHETVLLLKRSNRALPGILFILVVLAITLWLLLNPSSKPDGPQVDAVIPSVDSIVSAEPDTGSSPEIKTPVAVSGQAKAASKPVEKPTVTPNPAMEEALPPQAGQDAAETEATVDPALIDEVFRQATVMFEE